MLEVTPEGGRALRMWIDRSSHLLFRTDERQAEDHVVVTYGDYRAVDGIVLPLTICTGDGDDPDFDEVSGWRRPMSTGPSRTASTPSRRCRRRTSRCPRAATAKSSRSG